MWEYLGEFFPAVEVGEVEFGDGGGGVVLVDEVVYHAPEVVVHSLEDVAAWNDEWHFFSEMAGTVDHDASFFNGFSNQPPFFNSWGEGAGIHREYLLEVPYSSVD